MSSVDDALREQINTLQEEHESLEDKFKKIGISLRDEKWKYKINL